MKCYLASRYSRYIELQEYRADLEKLGHTVTSRWINGGHKVDDQGLSQEAEQEERIRLANEDVEDLMEADWIIAFTEAPRSSNSRGGRHVEWGIALATSKRVIVIGHRENVFYCLPQVEFYKSWQEFKDAFKAS